MKIRREHAWDVSFEQARKIQVSLAARRRDEALPASIRRVAGADVAYGPRSDRFYAAVVLLSFPTLEMEEVATASGRVTFPYVPGYLSFREGPILLEAFKKLQNLPEVAVFDGHGLAHPRRFGIACHLGVLLDLPSIGCGKSRLVGHFKEPGKRRGCGRMLVDKGEVIGKVLRTRTGVQPVFVSTGHRVRLGDAVRFLLRCSRKYRIPEPTRLADIAVNRLRRKAEKNEEGSFDLLGGYNNFTHGV